MDTEIGITAVALDEQLQEVQVSKGKGKMRDALKKNTAV